jgi:hypothetical protein
MRHCGDCTLCCRLVPVPELSKIAGQRCDHQFIGGCRIYRSRPVACRLWNCAWLVQPETHEMSRPDRSHYVIDIVEDFVTATNNDTGETFPIPVIQVWVDPKHRDAHKDPALRDYLDKKKMAAIVRYSSGEGFVLAPPSVNASGKWHEQAGTMVDEKKHAENAAMLRGRGF